MKKAVSKCLQVDAPETELPPFRYLNRFTINLVNMANNNHGYGYHHNNEDEMMKMMKMMMRRMMNSDSHDRMDTMDMDHMDFDVFSKMFKSMKSNNYDSYKKDDYSPMMKRFMGGFQKRQADDSLELNDRLKEKLERLMEDHVSEMSNMTCVLREMNVLDTRNKIDVAAMKADSQNYNMPSEWFKQEYFSILDNCYEVAENQPAELDNMFNMPGMQHMGKVKSFLTCKKSAKMRLCMNQDTKKKIETNFGPVEELLQSFNNQINEEQLFFMVNELLQDLSKNGCNIALQLHVFHLSIHI